MVTLTGDVITRGDRLATARRCTVLGGGGGTGGFNVTGGISRDRAAAVAGTLGVGIGGFGGDGGVSREASQPSRGHLTGAADEFDDLLRRQRCLRRD